jgi:DNA-binding NarL/FixJ family response regulator
VTAPTIHTRVLVIDDEPQVRSDLGRLLSSRGYYYQAPEGVGAELIARACAAAAVFRPHVAIVDLRLGGEYLDDETGIELLGQLRSARCILYSARLTPEAVQVALKKYGASEWVSKGGSPRELLRVVEEAALKACAFQRGLAVRWPAELGPEAVLAAVRLGEVIPERIKGLSEDILARLFPTEEPASPGSDELVIETLPGSRAAGPGVFGHSIGFKARRANRLAPLFIKIAPVEPISREISNYRTWEIGRAHV